MYSCGDAEQTEWCGSLGKKLRKPLRSLGLWDTAAVVCSVVLRVALQNAGKQALVAYCSCTVLHQKSINGLKITHIAAY